MERVGSSNAYAQLLGHARRLQATLAEQQTRLATSQKAQSFDGVSGNVQIIQATQDLLTRTDAMIASNKVTLSRFQTKYAALKGVSDLAIRAQSLATGGLQAVGSENVKAINSEAELMLRDMQSTLNRTFDGAHLFSGSATDQRPVALTIPPATPPKAPGNAKFDYYKGAEQPTYTLIGEQNVLRDGITAKDPAFEKTIRALEMLSGVKQNEPETMKEAYSLLKEANVALSNRLSQIGTFNRAVKGAISEDEQVKLSAGTFLGAMTKSDPAQVMAEMAGTQAALKASFLAISKQSQLSLLEYLR